MRLITRLTLLYLGITSVVLIAGGVLVFRSVLRENDDEEIRRLRAWMEDTAARLHKNTPVDSLRSIHIDIDILDENQPVQPLQIIDTVAWHSRAQGEERQLLARASYKINGYHYLISARDFAPEPEETIRGVTWSLSWIFVSLLLLVVCTSIFLSGKILNPFNQTLQAIQLFHVKQKKAIQLPETSTREFRELNRLLTAMTNKALDDYRSLKEFTENASHELQTPLAIIRGKLELLLESPINDEQAKLIIQAHEAVEKLSKINQSLTLLARLENREFESFSSMNFSASVHQMIVSMSELIEMKSITLQTNIEENVMITLNTALSDILLMNLLSNAIRHNSAGGTIRIELTSQHLLIRNTGAPLQVPPEELFLRFKKNNQSSNSVGLGLSIVKGICDLARFSIEYTYDEGWHTVKLRFAQQK